MSETVANQCVFQENKIYIFKTHFHFKTLTKQIYFNKAGEGFNLAKAFCHMRVDL